MSDQLDDAVAELYRRPPEDFTTSRAERVKALRESGDAETAKQVAALRKPTVGAWLVNLLVADEPSLGEQVTALADQLRTAQEQLAGEDLRALGRQRQELVSGLVARARGLARDAGRKVTGSVLDTEVESTLRAALADPDVAREVLSGRLTHATEFTGFGPASPTATPPATPPASPPASPTASPTATTPPLHDREGKSTRKTSDPTHDHGKRGAAGGARGAKETAAERRRAEKRAQLQERLRAAEEARDEAEAEHASAEKDKAATESVLGSAQEQFDALRAQLDEAQAARDEAAESDEKARWRTRRAAAALKAAQASVTRAAEALDRADR
jgi:hypothetical protein